MTCKRPSPDRKTDYDDKVYRSRAEVKQRGQAKR